MVLQICKGKSMHKLRLTTAFRQNIYMSTVVLLTKKEHIVTK